MATQWDADSLPAYFVDYVPSTPIDEQLSPDDWLAEFMMLCERKEDDDGQIDD